MHVFLIYYNKLQKFKTYLSYTYIPNSSQGSVLDLSLVYMCMCA